MIGIFSVIDAMKNYHLLDSCENCKHVFVMYEIDSLHEYYCTVGAGERPWCGSVQMDENHQSGVPLEKRKEAYAKGSKKWDAWAKGREVRANGKCDNWEI